MSHGQSASDHRGAELIERCRRYGFRVTAQRLEVLRQVVLSGEHPDAEEIHGRVRERLPTVSLDTVYRTLRFLEEQGLIQRLSRLHGSARYDGNTRQHHHFVCTVCGGVWDFTCEALDHLRGPPEVASFGTVASFHAELHGVCTACQAARAKVRKPRRT